MDWIVKVEDAGLRVDVLCGSLTEGSREWAKKKIRSGEILLNGKVTKGSVKLEIGDQITLPDFQEKVIELIPQDLNLDIIYEDDDILVVNKPKGMVVHPAPGSEDGTLVNGLLYHTKHLSNLNGDIRPGIVHRIDKDTSGLLMVAKNNNAHQSLAEQLQEHSILREYRGIVKGKMKQDVGTIQAPIGRHPKDRVRMAVVEDGGKDAITHFEVVSRYQKGYTQMIFHLETGRTHQIRVHMASVGHPMAGDKIYGGDRGNPFKTQGQCLHAQKLGFIHPTTRERMEFEALPPESFEKIIRGLGEAE